MRGIKIPQQDFALKMQGGLCARGGGVRDTTNYALLSQLKFLNLHNHFILA